MSNVHGQLLKALDSIDVTDDGIDIYLIDLQFSNAQLSIVFNDDGIIIMSFGYLEKADNRIESNSGPTETSMILRFWQSSNGKCKFTF